MYQLAEPTFLRTGGWEGLRGPNGEQDPEVLPDSQHGLCVHEPTATVISTQDLNETTPRSVGIPAENANWTQWATKKKVGGGHEGRGNGKLSEGPGR